MDQVCKTVEGVARLLLVLGVWGCGSDCLDALPRTCEPLYEAKFDNVYASTLEVTCARSGCHAAADAKGGMALGSANQAYDVLTGRYDGVSRVIAGDPECSVMIQRLESSDPAVWMPPEGQLPPRERCSIMLWVAAGAQR